MIKKPTLILLAIIVLIAIGIFVSRSSTPISVSSTETIVLENGATYDLSAGYVSKIIGGKEQKMLAYNGSIPGPTIRVKQGAEVTINFKNNTDMPALLHSHGVRMDNAFDGSQLQQEEMKPGESFSYKLKFPDSGIYWYHPHAKEVYGQGLGLYGAFIVEDTDGNYFSKVNKEVPIFLSDIPVENGKIALDKNEISHSLMGHYGNMMLVNGEESFNLDARVGEVLRLYVVNASNARPYNFVLGGLQMKLVGADSGAYEKASFVDRVILGPSERAIIDVFVAESGTYKIENKTPEKTYTLGTITVANERTETSYESEFKELQSNQATIQSIDTFRKFFNIEPMKKIALTLDMGGEMMNMPGMGHGGHMMPDGTMMGGSMTGASPDGIEWEDDMAMMNQMSNTDSIKWKMVDQQTGKENMDIDWTFKRGEPVKIRIFNDPKSMHPMQHPIHFHGQRFLVVARDGVKQTNLVWKDTTLVKSGETVDIILDPSNPGEWMAHCHISEHLEAGMMMKFKVK